MSQADVLVKITHMQEKVLMQLLDVVRRERHALKENSPQVLPGLLSELQDVASEAMRVEVQRTRVVGMVAEELGCPGTLKDICEFLPEEEGLLLKEASAGLVAAVTSMKKENFILSRQAEEHRVLGEMVLERLKNFSLAARGSEGGLDARA
jgi:phage I-like protein